MYPLALEFSRCNFWNRLCFLWFSRYFWWFFWKNGGIWVNSRFFHFTFWLTQLFVLGWNFLEGIRSADFFGFFRLRNGFVFWELQFRWCGFYDAMQPAYGRRKVREHGAAASRRTLEYAVYRWADIRGGIDSSAKIWVAARKRKNSIKIGGFVLK